MKRILLIFCFLNINFIALAKAQTIDEFLIKANQELKEGNFDQAIVDYTSVIDINPNVAEVYNNRGISYAYEHSYERAIADFTMAIASNPNDAQAYNNRGNAYMKLGNFNQAVLDYTLAIKHNAFYTKAYTNRQMAYFNLGQYDKAWADVRMVKTIGGQIDPRFIQKLTEVSASKK